MKTGKGLGLAYPRIRKHHKETAHNRQVTEKEVEVKNETVAERLGNNNADETAHGILGVLADNNEGRAGGHGKNVDKEEQVGDAIRNCRMSSD